VLTRTLRRCDGVYVGYVCVCSGSIPCMLSGDVWC